MAEENSHDQVVLSPTQSNEVIEEKLVHLKPALEGILCNLEQLRAAWKTKDVSWKVMWDNAFDSQN